MGEEKIVDYQDEGGEGQEEEDEEEEEPQNDSEEEVYDMFSGLNLSETVPQKFNFAEDYSHDEDAVLDNSEGELENVTPLKPHKGWKKKHENTTVKESKVEKKIRKRNINKYG